MWFGTMESNVVHNYHIFTKKEISHLPPTFVMIIDVPRVPVPHVPTSLASQYLRPLVPVLVLYSAKVIRV